MRIEAKYELGQIIKFEGYKDKDKIESIQKENNMNLGEHVTFCPLCLSKEIDIMVGDDVECRDCGNIMDLLIAEEACLSLLLYMDIGIGITEIEEEAEVK